MAQMGDNWCLMIVLTRYNSAQIVPAFAECLATMPNLTTIQGMYFLRDTSPL